MQTEGKSLNKNTILIISTLLLAAAALRLFRLDYQSLWLDEMHTMLFCNPATSWKEYWKEIGADVHPPLHYTLLRILFQTIAYTSVVARIVSAIAGIIAIWAIFLLGREIKDNRLGLIAASITTLNYYAIYFSQEARNYMLSFLLVTLSFLYFIRLIKTQRLKHSIWYGVYTLLLLYCHYYAAFIICAQILIGLIFFLNEEKPNRLLFIKRFLLSAAIVAVGFSPWVRFLTSVTDVNTTWIPMPANSFVKDYFNEYFGNSELLVPVFAGCILIFIVSLFFAPKTKLKIKEKPLLLAFVVCGLWITITYLLPYLRSITAVPMLYGRYTIVVLPAIIICISYGIIQTKYLILRVALLGFILVESFIDLGFKRDYYTRITKTQFREMISYVSANYSANEPVIDEISPVQQQYYFKIYGIQPNILPRTKTAITDAILTLGTSLYNTKGFWIIGAHHEKRIDTNRRLLLEQRFECISNVQYLDAWSEYYVGKSDTALGITYIDYKDVAANPDGLTKENEIILRKGNIQFKPQILRKGKYQFIVSVRGTMANEFYPNLSIFANGKKMGDLQTAEGSSIGTFYWETVSDAPITFGIRLTNDDADPENNADRDAFIKSIRIKRLK